MNALPLNLTHTIWVEFVFEGWMQYTLLGSWFRGRLEFCVGFVVSDSGMFILGIETEKMISRTKKNHIHKDLITMLDDQEERVTSDQFQSSSRMISDDQMKNQSGIYRSV